MDEAGLQAWIGREQTETDLIAPAPLAGLAAVLDHADPPWIEGEAPPLGHWLYFLPRARQSEIGEDGHPRRGGFLPPVDLPRRMWAGGRLEFHAPLPVDAQAQRRSTIAAITPKTGTSGRMVFVTVRHEISAAGRLAVIEEQDLVYREAAAAPAPAPAGAQARGGRVLTPDPVLLFRFSALTFNAHRIHYDRAYAVEEEGYPGLVVHGPLIATLLMDAWLRENPGVRPKAFSFRAQRPLYASAPMALQVAGDGARAELRAEDPAGQTAMQAQVES